VIEKIKDSGVIMSYTRWVEVVQVRERKTRKFI